MGSGTAVLRPPSRVDVFRQLQFSLEVYEVLEILGTQLQSLLGKSKPVRPLIRI